MKLTISQSIFNQSLQSVNKAVPSRPSHPILGNVLLSADYELNFLALTGFDLRLGIRTTIDAQIEESGSYTLPAKLLSDIISRLPDADLDLEINKETGTATIKTATGSYQVQGIPSEEFPDFPEIETANSGKLTLETSTIKQALASVLFSASNDETKQVLCGVNIHLLKDGTLKLATTDGHRLSVATIPSTQLDSDVEITIPAKTLTEVLKVLVKQKAENFDIEFDSTQVQFILEDTLITSRVLDGQYPAYSKLIPSTFQRTLEVNRAKLLNSLERIAVLADQKQNTVKLEATSEKVKLAVEAQDIGNGNESINCDYTCIGNEDDSFVIGFNIKYLSEALKTFTCDEITISMNTALSPCILKGSDDESFVHLIMPIQIREK